MKNLLVLILLLKSGFTFCEPLFDTTGGRYRKPVFDSVQVFANVQYAKGLNASGTIQNLAMDVYMPFGDTLSGRPVIVLVHGGGFISGSKADMAYSCSQFAKKGFVTVSIQYRLGLTTISSRGVTQMLIRATQDLKNAIRFLRKSTTTANPFRIQPEFIFAGGFSAGAITAIHAAYLDNVFEIPADQNIPDLDSLNNEAQYPGIDWRFKAIINIAGSIGDTNWIDSGDLPIISFHGTADATVPFISGSFGLPSGGGNVPMFGSQSIFNRCKRLGIKTELRPFPGAGHAYTSALPWAADTTEARISKFLIGFLTQPVSVEISKPILENNFKIVLSGMEWLVSNSKMEFGFQLFDLNGKLIQDQGNMNLNSVKIKISQKHQVLKLLSGTGRVVTKFLPAFTGRSSN